MGWPKVVSWALCNHKVLDFYLLSHFFQRLQESMTKKSAILDRDAEYVKNLKVSRLPGYLTVQMVRFQFKQKEAMNAKILKDIKFPMMLDTFDFCTPELQDKLVCMRKRFKEYEDAIVMTAQKGKGGKEAAFKKAQEENENKEMENYWFDDDLGSNNSGYYELQAVLTHKGRSSNSGHYVAWVKYKGDTWIECNDDDVNPIHVEDVLKLSGGGKICNLGSKAQIFKTTFTYESIVLCVDICVFFS